MRPCLCLTCFAFLVFFTHISFLKPWPTRPIHLQSVDYRAYESLSGSYSAASLKPLRPCMAVVASASVPKSTKAQARPGMMRTPENPAYCLKSVVSISDVASWGRASNRRVLFGGATPGSGGGGGGAAAPAAPLACCCWCRVRVGTFCRVDVFSNSKMNK